MKTIFKIFILNLLILSNFSVLGQTKEEDIKTATILFNEANILKQSYKLDEAKQKYSQAAELFKKNESWQNYVFCIYSSGDVMLFKNKFDDAQKLYLEAETNANAHLAANNKIYISIYFGLGNVMFYKGNVNEAKTFYNKSLNLNTTITGGSNVMEANLFTALGNSSSREGNFEQALLYYTKDLELKIKLEGENSPNLATTYNNISLVLESTGDYENALMYIKKALDLNLITKGENSPETAACYSKIGSLYYNKVQYDLALEYINKTIEIMLKTQGELNIQTANAYQILGNILKDSNKSDDAMNAYKKSLNIQISLFGENHPDLAGLYNNIGNILKDKGKTESALIYFQKAIKITSDFLGETNPEIALYYNNIGRTYHNIGNLDKALENYLISSDIYERNYSEKYSGLIKIYANIGNIFIEKKNYTDALKYLRKGIISNAKDFNPDSTDYLSNPKISNFSDINQLLFCLQDKALALNGMYIIDSLQINLQKSLETYILCDSLYSIVRKNIVTKDDRIKFSTRTQSLYENAILTSIELSEKQSTDTEKTKYNKMAFYFSERNKAGVLSEAIKASEAQSFAGIPEELQLKEKEITIQISDIQKKMAEESDQKELTLLRNKLFSLNNSERELNKTFELNYPDYFQLKYKDHKISAENIQKTLGNKTELISYFLGDKTLIIFLITNKSINVETIEKKENFDKKIEYFRKIITSGYKKDMEEFITESPQLYDVLIPNQIGDEIENLIIIPDGILGIIPFEALFYDKFEGLNTNFSDFPFLIKKYNISYYYSSELFFNAANYKKQHSATRKDWIGIAPVFDKENRTFNEAPVSSIPASEEEINNISSIFTGKSLIAETKFRKDASEKYIKSGNLAQFKYVHIATHGIVNIEKPELSCIMLSKEDSTENDGILYSGEIYNLKLDADLTVLSACETGLGKIIKGEGIIGLSHALLCAGTDNIIVSLWKVSDKSTSILMSQFYSTLLNSQSTNFSNALRDAKLKLISDPKFSHPFFWSPFILIGK